MKYYYEYQPPFLFWQHSNFLEFFKLKDSPKLNILGDLTNLLHEFFACFPHLLVTCHNFMVTCFVNFN